MKTQKCIIWFDDGTKGVYVGSVQYDVDKRPKVKKVQFTVPLEDAFEDILPEDDAVSNLMNMFGMKK